MSALTRNLGRFRSLVTCYERSIFSSPHPTQALYSQCKTLTKRHFCQKSSPPSTTDPFPPEDDLSNMPTIFPDPRDPHQHPLAPLSTEEMQENKQYWNKVQSTQQAPVYRQKLLEDGRAYAIGSRKRSKAKVWIGDGEGHVVVNGKPWVDYFNRIDHRDKILRPFAVLGLIGKVDVECTVRGGGLTGQAEALRHGISRALQNWDPMYRPALKSEGLLTRDSREVESKKYGRKKARKAFQWVKR